jgi:hypothetical protein
MTSLNVAYLVIPDEGHQRIIHGDIRVHTNMTECNLIIPVHLPLSEGTSLHCMLCCIIVLYCILLYRIVFYCIVSYCIVLYHIVVWCAVLRSTYRILLRCALMYSFASSCTVWCVVLHFVALHCIAFSRVQWTFIRVAFNLISLAMHVTQSERCIYLEKQSRDK